MNAKHVSCLVVGALLCDNCFARLGAGFLQSRDTAMASYDFYDSFDAYFCFLYSYDSNVIQIQPKMTNESKPFVILASLH